LNTFLSGLTVIDLSQYIPGPLAGLTLADFGADVLKIEPPRGDDMVHLGPRAADGGPLFYRALNAGKRVRQVDLKQAEGLAEFRELARGADILIEGFRPGVTERLGVDYATLRNVNARLIYCSISGFGADEGASRLAAHDGNFLAASGLMDRNGTPPRAFDPPLSDCCGALFAAIAILAALNGRARTGEGCHIDLALADTMAPLQLMQIADYGERRYVPKTDETYLNGAAAYYQVYATVDLRHLMLGAVEPKFWRAFCEAAQRPDWIARQGEALPQHALIADVARLFASWTLADVLQRFAGVDCCLSPVLDLGEALEAPRIGERGLVRRAPASGELQALFPARIDGVAPMTRAPLREG
jgi:crotonobetainyl-CoA:carnitine CoA-transferase CaiB-like acyl-CoA transferase